MKQTVKRMIQGAVLMACASALGYSNPIEGGSTATVTNDWNVAFPWLIVGSNSSSNTLAVTDGGMVLNQIGYIGNANNALHNQVLPGGIWVEPVLNFLAGFA